MSAFALDAPTIGAYAYALINPLQVDKAAWIDLPCTAVVPHAYREQPHLFPRLVELKKIDATQHSNLIERNQQWIETHGTAYFCALLKTELSAEGLRTYLARQMYQYHHARREYDVIRLHDPRVFRHFRWLLSNQQWDALLGPINSWAWPEPNGSWMVRDHLPAPGSYHVGRPWLAEKQWQSLLRLDEINGLLMHLTRVAPELIDDEALAQQIDTLVAEAREDRGLVDKADRRCYVEQVLRFHPTIYRHPQIHARLEQARARELDYVQACADLDEPTMRRFVTELSLGQGS